MDTDALIEAVVERIAAEVDEPAAEAMAGLARAYLRRLAAPDRSVDEAYHEVRGLFEFSSQRSGDMAVRAFNPTLEEHGYATEGTVVEVNVEDSPFLLDSVSGELQAHGLEIERVLHPVMGTERDADGHLLHIRHARHTTRRESVQHYEVDRRLFDADLPGLERSLRSVLRDVRLAVRDFHAMLGCLDHMKDLVRVATGFFPDADIEEAVAFLDWLGDGNFVLLGFREYQVIDTPKGKGVQVVHDTGLGILADTQRSKMAEPVAFADMAPDVVERYTSGDLLVITKTNRVSTVHRRAKMDYVGVRVVGSGGKTVGEARLLGLFTTKAYMAPAFRMPILRRKLAEVVASEDLIEGSHDHKAVIQLFEGFSKEDLFAAPTSDLRRQLMGLLALHEQHQVRLFVRRDLLQRSVSVLVALPRDRFNAHIRRQLQDLFVDRFAGSACEYHLALGESDPAQLHFTVWVDQGFVPEVRFDELEAEVLALTRSWRDRVAERLALRHRHEEATILADRWCDRFPEYYSTSTDLDVVCGDIERLEELASSDRTEIVGIQNEVAESKGGLLTRVSLYRRGGKKPLTELVPALENLGLVVVEEVPSRVAGPGDLFIHDFGVIDREGALLDVTACGDRVRATLEAVWGGEISSDSLHRLVITAGLDHRQIEILQAYRTYWRRVAPVFTIRYVDETLIRHPDIARKLVTLIEQRFHPELDGSGYEELYNEVVGDLDLVPSLDEDRILRAFLRMIEATVRTNAYLPGRQALAFKIDSARVPDVPSPPPLVEVFVMGPDVEGIHLRGGRVARGGIRWSTRREDYRTEVLGLMRAQMTKNAVIVPTGAKGGFVLREVSQDPAELRAEVERQYRVFIGALLDVTDNFVGGEVLSPPHVRVHDAGDPYLVVAADKGTATFSDVANSIARERGFWLGDAFASGGSAGYDHKALGITARGAWRSLERHFKELGLDPASDEFTVIGIGDMSGDVFGNGMLCSDRINLVAAFDHRHVFLDPDPDPNASYVERKRLFEMPGSSWADYRSEVISPGGGVYPRSAKKIELTPEIRQVLGVTTSVLTPSELIQAILVASVDLLWIGGIGTFVKASTESHDSVGDRTNDGVRVNASELGCRVVVEGGNLGFTPSARVEFALKGGRINTDFIDNSGGVDCSDREVNLKILLGLAEERGELDRAGRDQLITAVADDIVRGVLYDNFQQAQMLSQEQEASSRRFDSYEDLMVALEEQGILDRRLEALPSSEDMAERARAGGGLTRPELAVLLADAKRSLQDQLVRSTLPDDPYLLADLERYFPPEVVSRFPHLLSDHPLRRELVAMMLANDVVNSEGVVFVSTLSAQTGAEAAEIVAAYRAARDAIGAVDHWEQVEGLFGSIDLDTWSTMMRSVDQLVASLTRWHLSHGTYTDLGGVASGSRQLVEEMRNVALRSGTEEWEHNRDADVQRLVEAGVPRRLAEQQAVVPLLVFAPDLVEVCQASGRSVEDVFEIILQVGRSLGLVRLTDIVRSLDIKNRWERWAVWTIEEDLISIRRLAVDRVLETAEGRVGREAVDHFLASRATVVARLVRFMRSFESVPPADTGPLMVALRQVRSALS